MDDLRLIIVGGCSPEYRDYYVRVKGFIEQKNLTEYVRILGYQQDAVKILKCMDFYVSSSLSEGLPISVLEACASGIPTVATEITGNKDILSNSIFGVLVKPNCSESLAGGIIKMIKLTKNERDTLIQNARERIKVHFSIDEMALKTTLLYRKILSKEVA